MKKVIFTLALSVFVLCDSFTQSQIHIVGFAGDDAVYWNNGRLTVLPKSGNKAMANAIVVSGSNVYIAGCDVTDEYYGLYDAVYWHNGRRIVLPKTGRRAEANAIAVSGSNVYIAGNDYSDNNGSYAVYWLNGERIELPRNFEYGNGATAKAITASGSDVYIAGANVFEAAYWLNGRLSVLPSSRQLGGEGQRASGIAVSGSNVYVIGNGSGGGAPHTAGYWLNGRLTVLPKSGKSPRANANFETRANAITVSGSNVYIAGYDGWSGYYEDVGFVGSTDAVYWLNGRVTVLPKLGDSAVALAVAVSGSNVYVAGIDGEDTVYWQNGRRIVLPKLNISGMAVIE